MGIYDECVDVRHPVIGQYCLSEIKLIPPTGKNYSFNRTENLDDFGNKDAWKTVLGWGDYPDQVQRNSLSLGICIPDSCTAFDLQTSLQNKLNSAFDPKELMAVVKVDPIMCTVKGDMYHYNTAYYVTSIFFLLIVLICHVTTLHHFIRISCSKMSKGIKSENVNSFCKTFSFIESGKTLSKFDKDNELNALYGFKFLTMMVVLLGHRLFYVIGNPMNNPKYIENMYLNGPNIILTSTNIVDPFFFISGFLMHLNVSRSIQKAKGLSQSALKKITSPIIHRVMRILPAYCAMMAITAHIVPHLGDGPLWPQKIWDEAEICKNYWWTNLLFISNLIDVKYACLIVSWYVSCDVQFFVIGVIIVYVYTKNTKYGIGLLGTILGLCVCVPFVVTILSRTDGIHKMQIPYLENLRIFISLNKTYRLSYMRATPFFFGLAMSFIVEKLKQNKVQFSQMTVYIGTLVAITIGISAQLYGGKFYNRQLPYYPLEHALYSIVCHSTWTLPSMWILICLFTSGYGPLLKLFNNRITVTLGRLSYSVFMVNVTVMMISQSSQRLPIYLSLKSVVDAWIYDTFKSYVMGLALYLVIEAPFAKLVKPWV
ncbi:nose resistant to fluoxetine protein 6-like isoform X3 [Myzus persicae]|nr:nose resistant to fluoxetine protein 6-like isoform X3 [Myzus persicae]